MFPNQYIKKSPSEGQCFYSMFLQKQVLPYFMIYIFSLDNKYFQNNVEKVSKQPVFSLIRCKIVVAYLMMFEFPLHNKHLEYNKYAKEFS